MANRTKTAGEKLRQRFEDSRIRESEASKSQLEWTEHELTALEAAAEAADQAEVLRERWATAAQNPETSLNALVKLSGELRALDRQVSELLAKVQIEPKPNTPHRGRPGTA